MELIKGLYKDVNKGKTPHGAWHNARNIVVSAKHKDITNEEGFELFKQYNGEVIGHIVTNNEIVVFVSNLSTGEIHVIDAQKNSTCVLRSNDLNFNIDNPIEGVFTFNNSKVSSIVLVSFISRICFSIN